MSIAEWRLWRSVRFLLSVRTLVFSFFMGYGRFLEPFSQTFLYVSSSRVTTPPANMSLSRRLLGDHHRQIKARLPSMSPEERWTAAA